MKPRLLITGAAGFLGRYLTKAAEDFSVAGTIYQTPTEAIPGVSFHVCDLQQPDAVKRMLDRVRPDVIIHTACSERGEGLKAIVPAAGLLAMQTGERHIRFLHLSTDQVFDGTSAPYTEENPTNPLNPYGRAKTEAETLIRSLNPRAALLRTSLLYDLRTPDRQTARLIKAAQTGEPYRLFTDEFRCPVWVENLAEALLELATNDYEGVLHLGGPQRLNRWEFGMSLLHHFGITPAQNIQPGTIEESGLVRPPDLTMNSSKACGILSTPILSFNEARAKISTQYSAKEPTD